MYSRQELVEKLQRLAQEEGLPSVSRTMWIQRTGINEYHITKHFESWNHFVTFAGLEPIDNSRIPDDELFEKMLQYFVEVGGITTRTRFSREAQRTADVYSKRWGRWVTVLRTFGEWARLAHPGFPYFDQIETLNSGPAVKRPVAISSTRSSAARVWPSVGGRRLGPVLNFRGLQHEPVNEDGVIFLFGMVAHDLGFIVEHIAAAFPDCEAKRRVSHENWERVRIEFEFESRNFVTHGHNFNEVDLVV